MYAADFGGGSFFGSTYMGLEGGVFREGHRAISTATSVVGGVTLPLKETLIRDQGINFKMKVGRLLSETTLFYGSLGIERSRFTYHAALNATDSKKSKSLWGIAPGLGIKTRLSDCLSLDLGYSYTLYQHSKITQLPIGTNRVNTKMQPRFSAARIGLSIKL
jgi:opacity protein-like surface antigen